VPHIETEYIRTGKLRYYVRDFPLESIHPQAFKAAEAAHCAAEEGKYWEMHNRFFANPRALGATDLPGHAETLGLDKSKFQSCLDSGRYGARVRKDLADGQAAGVRGTPTFFLGVEEPHSNRLRIVQVIRGAQGFSGFKAAIDKALAQK